MSQQYDTNAGKHLHIFNDLYFTLNASFTNSYKFLNNKHIASYSTIILSSWAALVYVWHTESERDIHKENENPKRKIPWVRLSSYLFPLVLQQPLTGKPTIRVNPVLISDCLSQFKKFNSTACTGHTTTTKHFKFVAVLYVNYWMYPTEDNSLPPWCS